MNKFIENCKPALPKRLLFFIGAFVWAYAAFRVWKLAISFLAGVQWSLWLLIVWGIGGTALFFRFLFYKISKRYIQRIIDLPTDKPCLFAFFGWKSYLLILLMISMGILLLKFELIPFYLQGLFYMVLGSSLFISALMFFIAGIKFSLLNS